MIASAKNNLINKSRWLKVSELKAGMQIAICDPGISDGAVWDEIVSIESKGVEHVYDIEVEGTHNFVAGHVINKNTRAKLTEKQEKEILTENGNSDKLPDGLEFAGIVAHNTYLASANGNVGIGTTGTTGAGGSVNPSRLKVQGDSSNAAAIYATSSGSSSYTIYSYNPSTYSIFGESNSNYGVTGWSNTGTGVFGHSNGMGVYGYSTGGMGSYGVYCSGDYCGGTQSWTGSDIRLKERIETLPSEEGLTAIMKLNPVSFHWRDVNRDKTLGRQIGFIAQDVEQIFPDMVKASIPLMDITLNGSSTEEILNVKTIADGELIPPIIKAIQEMGTIIDFSNASTTQTALVIDAFGNIFSSGTISASSFNTVSSDIAENYPTKDIGLEAGDIVGIDFQNPTYVTKAISSQSVVLGVISEKPGVLLANSTGYEYTRAAETPVALSGRVPVKVNLDGGEIKAGDRIALSSTPGVGAKATSSGQTIGIALENFPSTSSGQVAADGTITYDRNAIGKILVFVNLSQYRLALEDEPKIQNLESRIQNLELKMSELEKIIATSSSAMATSSESIISQGFSWILEQFKNIGITIADGIIQARQLIADVITSREIATEYLQIKEQLVVGSKEKPIGMTIFEKGTGNPICVYAEAGILKTAPGECGSEALAGSGGSAGTVNALELPASPDASQGGPDNAGAGGIIPTEATTTPTAETATSTPATEPSATPTEPAPSPELTAAPAPDTATTTLISSAETTLPPN